MIKKRIGHYEPFKQEKNVNEAFIDGIKEGEIFWTIYFGEGSSFDTKSQAEAEIIGRLARIENMLKRKKR